MTAPLFSGKEFWVDVQACRKKIIAMGEKPSYIKVNPLLVDTPEKKADFIRRSEALGIKVEWS